MSRFLSTRKAAKALAILSSTARISSSPTAARAAYTNGWLPFGKKASTWLKLSNAWALSDKHWQLGKYHQAVDLRRKVLTEAVEQQQGLAAYTGPRLLSAAWCSNIGHLGLLAMFAQALQEGLVPAGRRTLVKGPNLGNLQVFQALEGHFDVAHLEADSSMVEHPALWPLVERLAMVFDGTAFIDTYSLWERLWRSTKTPSPNLFRMSEDYLATARNSLSKLGLPARAPFIALHIRSCDSLDPRWAPPESFIPAVASVLSAGVHVVHFGASQFPDLVDHPHYINLTTAHRGSHALHLFLLRDCRFLITTTSGPATVAMMLGTPVLHTNTTSIGRNIFSASRGSRFLPKTHYRSGTRLSLGEVLGSPQAYWEPSTLKSVPKGSRPQPNTSGEILAATEEMWDSVAPDGLEPSEFATGVDAIRSAQNAVGYGVIAESYLTANRNWFLD